MLMYAGALCLEVLTATIIAWIGIWGLIDEFLQCIEDKRHRCFIYAGLFVFALLMVSLQKQMTVCAMTGSW